MSDYRRVKTSAEVWAVILARHPEMVVFGSLSAPDGDPLGNPNQGRMFTSFCFAGGDYPVIEAQTTWDIARVTDLEYTGRRANEQHEYWLCVPNAKD